MNNPMDAGASMATLIAAGLLLMAMIGSTVARADAGYMGPEKCEECHKAEVQVWQGSKHFESFKKVHRSKDAKKFVQAIGEKSMKRSTFCTTCHYTSAAKKAGGKIRPIAGPSCESCHGPARDWYEIHNDYGGKDVKREQETAAHKQSRITQSRKAGMIWSFMLYDIAENCNSCHGMAHATLDADKVAKVVDAGHPINPDYELVTYSQGSVRHRFYHPDINTNKKMTPAELARTFVTGHAAALVVATDGAKRVGHPKYVAAQNNRIAAATKVMTAIAGPYPAAKALLSSPTAKNARALVAAIEGKDLSSLVGAMLPAPGSYK